MESGAVSEQPYIVVLGSINVDLVMKVQRLPASGETVDGSTFETHIGGKGANQAVAAARSGAQVHLIAAVGSDDYALHARSVLAAEGIDLTHVHTVDGPTGTAMIFVERDSGANCIGVNPGANGKLNAGHLAAAAELILGADLLICQLESPLPVVMDAMRLAREAGVPVLLNPAPPVSGVSSELLGMVDILVPNEHEARALLGLSKAAALNERQAATGLRELGAVMVLITLGERGVLCAGPGGMRRFASYKVNAIDTSGAGDTFIGAFAAACLRNCPFEDAVALGQAAAAVCVTRSGAMPSIPRLSEYQSALGDERS